MRAPEFQTLGAKINRRNQLTASRRIVGMVLYRVDVFDLSEGCQKKYRPAYERSSVFGYKRHVSRIVFIISPPYRVT